MPRVESKCLFLSGFLEAKKGPRLDAVTVKDCDFLRVFLVGVALSLVGKHPQFARGFGCCLDLGRVRSGRVETLDCIRFVRRLVRGIQIRPGSEPNLQ